MSVFSLGVFLGSFTDLQCNIQSCFISVVVHLMCKSFFSLFRCFCQLCSHSLNSQSLRLQVDLLNCPVHVVDSLLVAIGCTGSVRPLEKDWNGSYTIIQTLTKAQLSQCRADSQHLRTALISIYIWISWRLKTLQCITVQEILQFFIFGWTIPLMMRFSPDEHQ